MSVIKNDNSDTKIVIPYYENPDVTLYKESRDLFSKQIEYIQNRGNEIETTDSLKKDALNALDLLEESWGNKPDYFDSKESAKNYFLHVNSAICEANELINEIERKCLEIKRKKINWEPGTISIAFAVFVPVVLFSLFLIEKYDEYSVLKIIFSFILFFLVFQLFSAIIVISFIVFFERLNKREFDKNPPPPDRWIVNFKNDIGNFEEKFIVAQDEIFSDIEKQKQLMFSIKKGEIEEHFEEKKSKRYMKDRLAMIEAEAKQAIATAKNLEEQHRKTEAVRAKYAKEMLEHQQNIKELNDNALMKKIAQVNSLLSYGETDDD